MGTLNIWYDTILLNHLTKKERKFKMPPLVKYI